MLESIHIKNFALIDEVTVEFGPGFNVITGETGAGKSILLGALNLVLGARASTDLVRSGAAQARVDALFQVESPSDALREVLDPFDLDLSEGLIVSRTINADGRSKAFLGGTPVPLTTLAEIGDELVDLHGQHEHQSLLKRDRQLSLLDGFADTTDAVSELSAFVGQLRETERAIDVLEADDREAARRVGYLRHEVAEINGAKLQPDEEENLRGDRTRMTNAEEIHAEAAAVVTALYDGETAAIDSIGTALSSLDALAALDPRFEEQVRLLQDGRALVEEVANALREFAEEVNVDSDELDRINARLAQIGDLKRKFGASIPEILAHRDRAQAEIDAFTSKDARLKELRGEQNKLEAEALKLARQLSEKRSKAAKKLDKAIAAAMSDLSMKGGQFDTHFDPAPLGPTGTDAIEFRLSANPGEVPKPLKTIASGGEISRIMLAMKATFAQADAIPTLIFDEIDTGVGGNTAHRVAEKMAGLAASHQVICITHLAQLAARATTHWRVDKTTAAKKTVTTLTLVADEGRINEIARLLDGAVTQVSLDHARELLGRR